jgi:hypothetical protein
VASALATWVCFGALATLADAVQAHRLTRVIQGRDGTIHAIYSYFVPKALNGRQGKSMKHAAFSESWVQLGDR